MSSIQVLVSDGVVSIMDGLPADIGHL